MERGGDMSEKTKKKLVWGAGSTAVLAVSYGLSRHLLFSLHGMKSWPDSLAVFGFFCIIAAASAGCKALPAASAGGYLVGFGLAMLFQSDGLDPGGGAANNAWIIWGAVFLVCLLAGLLIDIAYFRRVKRKVN